MTTADLDDAQRIEMARDAYDALLRSIAGSRMTQRETYHFVPSTLLFALGEALYGPFTETTE